MFFLNEPTASDSALFSLRVVPPEGTPVPYHLPYSTHQHPNTLPKNFALILTEQKRSFESYVHLTKSLQ